MHTKGHKAVCQGRKLLVHEALSYLCTRP
jgi:hypothetical protein